VPRHELTTEERRRGAEKAAEVKREKREEARQLAAERLSGLVGRAIDELERLIDDDDARVRLRTAQQILDRALGKANVPIEIATVHHDRELVEARETLARRLEEIRERREPSQQRRRVALRDVIKVAREAGLLDEGGNT
jgi:sugar phosphate isomerase/epimerase